MKKPNYSEEWIKLRDGFLDHRGGMGRSENRLKHLKVAINYLYQFMMEKGITDIAGLTQADVQKFQYFMYQTKRMGPYMTIRHLDSLNIFCRYLHYNNLIYRNPLMDIKYVSPPELEKVEIKRYYNFNELLTRWTNYMKKNGCHIEAVNDRLYSVNMFIKFLKEKGLNTIYKVEPETIEEYKTYLSNYQYEPGRNYAPFTQVSYLRWVCQFLLYLHRERLIKQNPAKNVILRQYYKELDTQYRKVVVPIPRRKGIKISDPEIKHLLEKFIDHQLAIGGSKDAVRNYIIAAEKFYEFITNRNITDLRKVTKRDFMDFQDWLATLNSIKGIKYAPNTIQGMLFCLRSFFRYLTKYDYIICDHTGVWDMPKGEDGIPHTCMDEREVKLLLNQPNITEPIGLRNRAIMEVLYSTGVRAKELAGLKIGDIDFNQGLVRIDEPKGGKSFQRIVPIGKIACEFANTYITKVRPLFDKDNKGYLFLSENGGQLRRSYLSAIIRTYLFHSGLRKKITTHSFRVSCATHMLLHNADIRYVQQQLGHKSIRTTQGYTRLVPKDLKLIHARCHPREKICNYLVLPQGL